MKSKLFLLSCLSCIGCLCGPIAPASSFQLTPISQTFAPRGSQSTRSYKVINSNQKAIAVEISVMKREVDEAGQETLSPAEEDFVVYPTQILLNPLETQTVRVSWIGDLDPPSELSYRLVAEQLPVPLGDNSAQAQLSEKATASLDFMVRYVGSLYIQPPNAKPDVVLKSAALERDATGTKWLAIHLKNQGTARQVLKNPQLTVTAGGKSVLLQNEQLGAVHSQTLLAGGERRFRIPWPTELPEGDVSGRLAL